MNTILALARRELGAFFLSPIAYVVTAIFLLMSGLAFGLSTFNNVNKTSASAEEAAIWTNFSTADR